MRVGLRKSLSAVRSTETLKRSRAAPIRGQQGRFQAHERTLDSLSRSAGLMVACIGQCVTKLPGWSFDISIEQTAKYESRYERAAQKHRIVQAEQLLSMTARGKKDSLERRVEQIERI